MEGSNYLQAETRMIKLGPTDGTAKAPKLLILHATGLNAAAYTPLAAALSGNYECWSLALPGHHHGEALPTFTVSALADYVVDAIHCAGLRGCVCIGHSAGGALGLLACTRSPGLLSAIFTFEAVASTPATHAFMKQARDSGIISTAGQHLARAARRRRSTFNSKPEALAHLRGKMPFAGMHPQALWLYTNSMQPVQQQEQSCKQRVIQQQQPVQLACSPLTEAAYYEALDPPPPIVPQGLTCPVMMAVAGSKHNSCAGFTTHDAVRAWLLQDSASQHSTATGAAGADPLTAQSSGTVVSVGQAIRADSRAANLHSVLAVLNAELAASLPTAQLVEVQGVTHFGPLEKPALIANLAASFFLAHQRGQQPQCSLRQRDCVKQQHTVGDVGSTRSKL